MQSAIYRFFVKYIKKIADIFPHSVLGKVFFSICSFIQQTVAESIIGRFFKRRTKDASFAKESVFTKLLMLPIKIISFISQKISAKYSELRSSSDILYFTDNWNLVSIRIYGAALCSFGVVYAILRLFSGSLAFKSLAFCMLFIVSGICFILINRSLKSLFKGSFLLKKAGELFYDNAAREHSRLFLIDDAIHIKGSIAATILGAVLAVCGVLLSPIDFVFSIFGIIAILLILKYTELGIFIVAAASPILPTLVLAGLSILCAFSFCFRLIRKKDIKLMYSPLYIPTLLFALSYFLGTLNSFAFMGSAGIFLVHVSFILFYFVAYNILGNDKAYKAITSAFVLMAGLVALYGIAQNFIGVSSTSSWVDEKMFEDIKLRVYSTFDNPNVLGEYLVMMIPLAMAFLLRSEKLLHKIVYFAVLALCVLCLIFTWSRGAWLGAMLAVIIFLVATDKRWAICSLVLFVAIPFIPVILSSNSAIVGRITSIGDMSDSSTAYRVSIWQSALRVIGDFWLSGIGPGSNAFSLVYQKYAASGVAFALHSHNLFLQLLVELGIGGFLVFIVLLLRYVKSSVQTLLYENKKTLRSSVTIACTSGILGLMLQGMTDYVWYNYKILLIFWIVLAISTSKSNTSKKEDGYK
ncbi:MAG: hypothetical protein E7398_02060 [Ruminococcaceae bacterium]|nr:hypothetical protein [Oscillospiraceae bacterium]